MGREVKNRVRQRPDTINATPLFKNQGFFKAKGNDNGSNQVGRLVKVTDASGSQQLHYGKLGETVKEIRTIASHTQGQSKNSPEVYTTSYRYDSFGRLLELVLPDTETVTYVYDAGGSLTSFAGDKSGAN